MSIHVQTDFPGGNACAVETLVDGTTDVVRFAADPHGGIEALWFFFRVVECAERPVLLELTNLDSLLGDPAEWDQVRPVVRHAGGPWERISPPTVHLLPDGRHCAVWTVEPEYDSFEFAFCFPYSLGDLEVTRATCGDYWKLDAIGVTPKGRRLPRISNSYGAEESATPGLYLLARQHAGETPGSWVLDGLLRRAAETVDPSTLVIWTAPLANLDGVLDGDYGKDPFPHDLNRAWTIPPMRHEVLVLQRDMGRWSRRCRPALVVDLHAPGGTESDGAYFFLPRATRPAESIDAARRAVDAILPALPKNLVRPEPVIQPSYPSRWSEDGTLGVYVWEQFAIPALSMETPYSSSRGVLFTREEYRRLGARLLDGIHTYLKGLSNPE